MQTKDIFRLNWRNVGGAVVSAVIVSVLIYITNLANISQFDYHSALNIAVMVAATSLLKNFVTTSSGTVLGVPVK